MGRIIIDSLDKRITIPIINFFQKKGYKIDGICFDDKKPLSKKYIDETHYISKNNIETDLSRIIEKYTPDDYLIVGDPKIIEAVNKVKPHIKYIVPPINSVSYATDKRKLMGFAAELGIKTPRELNAPQYPMVIKLNTSEGISLKPAQRYEIVKNEAQYLHAVDKFSAHKENMIMQEYAAGRSYGVSMLFDQESNLIDYIVHERLLEYPISGGPSALCKSTYAEKLVCDAGKLLKNLGWQGLAMVEFKGDTLIEINPRFWGSLPLIFAAQSRLFENLISTMDKMQTMADETKPRYKTGKYMCYFPQCWIAVLMNIKSGNIKKALKSIPRIFISKEGILKLSDPAPFFRYLMTLIERRKGQ